MTVAILVVGTVNHLVGAKSMELQSVYNHRCLRPIGRFDGYLKSDVSASCNIYDISCFVFDRLNIQLEPIAETVLELGASCSKMQLGNYTCAGTWIFQCEVGFAIDATLIYLCGHMDMSVRAHCYSCAKFSLNRCQTDIPGSAVVIPGTAVY